MIRFTLAFFTTLASLPSFAQTEFYRDYDWQSSPKIHTVSGDDQKFPGVVITSDKSVEIVQGATETSMFTTQHYIVHVNSDAGIEKYNKVLVPFPPGGQLVALKVRSVAPDGRVTEFQKENLKELQNGKGFGNAKIFAIEGLTVGGELEYLYTYKSRASSFGMEILQREVPVKDASFVLISPKQLSWRFQSYNTLVAPTETAVDNTRSLFQLHLLDIPALVEEPYSAYKANLLRVEYKAVRKGKLGELVDWAPVAKLFLNLAPDEKGDKKIASLIRDLDLGKKTEQEKIIAVENYIKTNFTIKIGRGESYEDLRTIVSQHVGNDRGLVKLFMSCFNELGVHYQVVLANNRFEGRIDSTFATLFHVNRVLLYFPRYKQFLCPQANFLRLGAAPDEASNGLFIDVNVSGSGATLIGNCRVHDIEPLDYTLTTTRVQARISLQNDRAGASVEQENDYGGYAAFRIRGLLSTVQQDKEQELLTTLTLSGIDNPTLVKRTVEGKELSLSANPENEVVIRSTYTSPALVEKAGEDYIISIGKLIGRQRELYQETSRQTSIEMPSNTIQRRELRLVIPPHYQLIGIDKLTLSAVGADNGDEIVKFESSGVVKDDELIVTVTEFYKIPSLPRKLYDPFRSVVNAAADFNKVVVVLSPE
jgi:hypothetical protein